MTTKKAQEQSSKIKRERTGGNTKWTFEEITDLLLALKL